MDRKFDPARGEKLLREERARLQPVEPLLRLLDPKPGKRYADIGCGPGYFTLPVAERVRPGGKVYALDISPEMLAMCRERARERGLDSLILTLRNDEHTLPLEDASVDGAWLANVFHELEAPLELLREVRRILRPGGRLIVIDWKPVETDFGPPREHRVPAEEVRNSLAAAGFSDQTTHELYPYHYVIEARRPTQA